MSNVTTTVEVETSQETHKHKDLVFQQHLRNLLELYRTFIPDETISGILRWEADNIGHEHV